MEIFSSPFTISREAAEVLNSRGYLLIAIDQRAATNNLERIIEKVGVDLILQRGHSCFLFFQRQHIFPINMACDAAAHPGKRRSDLCVFIPPVFNLNILEFSALRRFNEVQNTVQGTGVRLQTSYNQQHDEKIDNQKQKKRQKEHHTVLPDHLRKTGGGDQLKRKLRRRKLRIIYGGEKTVFRYGRHCVKLIDLFGG